MKSNQDKKLTLTPSPLTLPLMQLAQIDFDCQGPFGGEKLAKRTFNQMQECVSRVTGVQNALGKPVKEFSLFIFC